MSGGATGRGGVAVPDTELVEADAVMCEHCFRRPWHEYYCPWCPEDKFFSYNWDAVPDDCEFELENDHSERESLNPTATPISKAAVDRIANDGSHPGYPVFVGNIPRNLHFWQLRKYFSTQGHVLMMFVLKPKHHSPSKCGFIFYEKKQEAQKVINTHKHWVHGKPVKCTFARRKSQHFDMDD